MIARSEQGPRCPHCGRVNPAIVLPEDGAPGAVDCIHCKLPFTYWIEKLPFYCTEDGRPLRCDCGVCRGTVEPREEVEP